MKKQEWVLFFAYAAIVVVSISVTLLSSLGLTVEAILQDVFWTMRLAFTIFFLILSVTILLLLFGWFIDESRQYQIKKQLEAILADQTIKETDQTDIGMSLVRLSKKMKRLTSNLQKTENAYISNSQSIVKQERRRIARDLHDTVSQELFASSMILSGLSSSLEQLDKSQLKEQLATVERIVNDAQNDLRVLLLHLRPTELEGKRLSDGLGMILKELTDKSAMTVTYKDQGISLPREVEEHLFRIAQEFISNTLKHAKAKHLEVYLGRHKGQLQFKMRDDGQGFDMESVRELSYGLKNIEERVDDMAGSLTFLSAPGHGVSMEIRLPLVEGEWDGED